MTTMTAEKVDKANVGQFWKSFVEAPRYLFTIGENEYEFVDYWPESKCVRAWLKTNKMGEHVDQLGLLPIANIPADILKDLPVWGTFSKEIQDNLLKEAASIELVEQQDSSDRMAHARKYKRGKYINVPKELICTKCNEPIKVQPAALVKRVEKLMETKGITYTMDDYKKTFECQKCHPTKGRKSTGKCIPIELVCKCGKKTIYPTNTIQKQAEKAGKTLEEFVKTWECRKCRPKLSKEKAFGGKRGRKANPEFVDLPKEMVCKCGKSVKTNPSYLKIKAKKEKTTIQELIKNFTCQECCPTKGRHKKGKGKK